MRTKNCSVSQKVGGISKNVIWVNNIKFYFTSKQDEKEKKYIDKKTLLKIAYPQLLNTFSSN